MPPKRPAAKETISYEKLKEFGKAFLKEPNADQYMNEDIVVVVVSHVAFLEAVAPFTRRLNPSSVGLVVKHQFNMSTREAELFGQAMQKAFGHCLSAGAKATTGQKLSKEVLAVYSASMGCKPVFDKRQSSESCESPRPIKALKKSISSPSKIDALYSCGSSSSHLKVII